MKTSQKRKIIFSKNKNQKFLGIEKKKISQNQK